MHARTQHMASSASLFLSLFIFAIAAFTPFSASSHSAPNSSASTPSDAAENSTLFALLAFKASIVHPSAGKLSSWNTSTHFCTWPGIICTSASNQVKDIHLEDEGLNGTLSPQIANLQELSWLSLGGNTLFGQLPSSLGRLKSLEGLYLSSNQFSGPLPSSYGQLASLQTLDLASNSLSGYLPSSLGRLKLLEDLDLSSNQFSGPLPSSYGQLTSLQTLNLASNSLSGHLPSSLGHLKHLGYLDLSANQFSGPLPSSYGQLTSLQTLNLVSNSLSGHLPSSLGQLKRLGYLDLSCNQFSGPLPSSFGQLTSLQTLGLASNSLSGHLPSSLGQLKLLEYLDLSWNQFSGPLPSSFGWMTSLQTLNFSQNRMSGHLPLSLGLLANLTSLDLSKNQLSDPLPPSLGRLVRLQSLDLSHNQLSGHLPSFIGQMENLFFLDVSCNQLEGLIPPEIYYKFSSSAFLGNSGLRSPLSFTVHNDHAKRNILLVIVFVVGALSLLALFSVWWYRIKSRDLGSNFVAPQYKAWTLEEMRVATNNFDAANAIGSGAVSMCYLGMMRSAKGIRAVALKRLVVDDYDGEDDGARESFVNEFKTICKVRHRNVVKVLGYCLEQGEVALVMEYMEGGDLDRRLHSQLNTLSWEERVNVALDVAEGLVYLHHEYDQPIIHCDIKPKNILLTKDMVAKISDFGIAKLMGVNNDGDMSMSKLRGSFGYMAPEYSMGLRISTKVDVYSFGMLLLELVTRVRPTSSMLENEAMSLHTWVKTLETSAHVRKVLHDHDDATLQEAKELLELGVLCTHDVAKKRPTMYVVRDFILQLKTTRL